MKKEMIIYPLTIFLFVFSSCANRIYNQPTRTYSHVGEDSLLIGNGYIAPDSIRILIVDFSNATESMANPEDWTNKKKSADFKTSWLAGYENSFGSSYTSSDLSGSVRSKFSDEIVLKRIIDRMCLLTDVVVVRNSSAHAIEKCQLDSIAVKQNVDLVIMLDSIRYDFNQKFQYISHTTNGMTASSQNGSLQMNYSVRSNKNVVVYNSSWNLVWMNKAEHSITKREKILQTGLFYNDEPMDPRADIMFCSMKAADDFIALFE